MKTITLVQPTKERNGILIKKTNNNINSCELRKVALSGRDNGYIASINQSGVIVRTGGSWRPPAVNSPVDFDEIKRLVKERFDEVAEIINQ